TMLQRMSRILFDTTVLSSTTDIRLLANIISDAPTELISEASLINIMRCTHHSLSYYLLVHNLCTSCHGRSDKSEISRKRTHLSRVHQRPKSLHYSIGTDAFYRYALIS